MPPKWKYRVSKCCFRFTGRSGVTSRSKLKARPAAPTEIGPVHDCSITVPGSVPSVVTDALPLQFSPSSLFGQFAHEPCADVQKRSNNSSQL